MRVLVLGVGMQGRAIAQALVESTDVGEVLLADEDQKRAESVAYEISHKVDAVQVDVRDQEEVQRLMRACDVAISAVPYFYNYELARNAVEARCSFCDLGGNIDVVFHELGLDAVAYEAGVTIIPDCGLAPGLTSVLVAKGVATLERTDTVQIRVGALPRVPRPPLYYQVVFSLYGLISAYTGKVLVLRDGQMIQLPALTEQEPIEFPRPVGRCEAALTAGGTSTLPWTYRGYVRRLDYKTVQYPGHYERVRLLRDLGLFDEHPVYVEGHPVRPRDLFVAVAGPRLRSDEEDVVVLRVRCTGVYEGVEVELVYESLIEYDWERGLTAMNQATAYPAATIVRMIGGGSIDKPGAWPVERIVPPDPFLEELARYGVHIEERMAPLEEHSLAG